jgi:ATP-dependent Lon protease
MVVPLFVGRDKSVRALEEVMRGDKQILLVTQKNSADDDPAPADIYDVGVLATVLQLLKLPDGTVKVLVEGKGRAAVVRFTDQEAYYEAQVGEVSEDRARALRPRRCRARSSSSSRTTSNSTRRCRPRPWPRSRRSPSRASWPTASPPTCR